MLRGLVVLFCFFIILVSYLILFLNKSFEYKKNYECIISINVHEKFDFLLKQLENIRNHVLCDYAIVLNCNDYMLEVCKQNVLPENVYIYPKSLNKKSYHGSLSEGIYNNIVYSLTNFRFDYFIVCSSRSFFGNTLKIEDLDRLVEKRIMYIEDGREWEEKKDTWHWGSNENTLLIKHCLEKKRNVYSSPHEGLVLTENGCKKIKYFLDNNPKIKEELFSFDSVIEEFAFQTISKNMDEDFYYIGNGCCVEEPVGPNDLNHENPKFMYKTKRE